MTDTIVIVQQKPTHIFSTAIHAYNFQYSTCTVLIGITGPMVTSVEDIYRVFNKPSWLPGYEEDKPKRAQVYFPLAKVPSTRQKHLHGHTGHLLLEG